MCLIDNGVINFKKMCHNLPKNFIINSLLLSFIFVKFSHSEISSNFSSNSFVDRCRRDCVVKRDFVVCGKYRAIKWLHEVAREKEFTYGPLKLINIPSSSTSTSKSNKEFHFSKILNSKIMKFGMSETLNFFRDVAEDVVKRRAIVYTYDPHGSSARDFSVGPMILDETELIQMQSGKYTDNSRLFKKKKAIILPVLILLNLIKLKLLIIPILFGVHLIKKLIIIGGLFVPGILSKLKICKVPYQGHPFHNWGSAMEAPVDYPTAYGHDDSFGWSHRNDIYSGGTPSNYGSYPAGYNPYVNYYRQR